MRLDQAFKRAGFDILLADKVSDSRLLFDVRVPLQGKIPARWQVMLEEVLTTVESHSKRGVDKWSAEVVKRFYSKNGRVHWNWRITLLGDLAAAQVVFVNATISALRVGNEVSEVTLVGQTNMRPDPANGKYKGAIPRDDDDRGGRMIANAFLPSSG